MFKRVGFFHFVESYGEPFRSLEKSLSEQDVTDSLVVLPEAFNNGKDYHHPARGNPKFTLNDTVTELVRLARTRGVVFVAGILNPPFSSAFWIDRNGGYLMCHKKTADGTGNYRHCVANCDYANPILYGNAHVGAVLCNEVDDYARPLAETLDGQANGFRLICIPAWMNAHWFGTGRLNGSHWSGKYVVLANSHAYGCGSFMANASGERQVHTGQQNKLVLSTWTDLDSMSSPQA